MHTLIHKHNLHGCFRWIVAQTNPIRNGELYRYIADRKGAFVQPALYEAFGLTVVEAMTCGLPVFVTNRCDWTPDRSRNIIALCFHLHTARASRGPALLARSCLGCLIARSPKGGAQLVPLARWAWRGGRPSPGTDFRLLTSPRRGGPAEIVVNKKSGFHIDPYHGEQAANTIADFFER